MSLRVLPPTGTRAFYYGASACCPKGSDGQGTQLHKLCLAQQLVLGFYGQGRDEMPEGSRMRSISARGVAAPISNFCCVGVHTRPRSGVSMDSTVRLVYGVRGTVRDSIAYTVQ